MGCIKARLAGTPLQLDILCLAQNLLAPDLLLPDGDGSFYSSVLCGKNAKMFFISGERGEPPKCAAGDGMLRASSHIFWGWEKCFGVIMMFSLLCSLLREPLGMMWDFEERAGKSPPSFTHSVTCDRFMPAALLGFICSLNFISPLWVFILLRDCQGSC